MLFDIELVKFFFEILYLLIYNLTKSNLLRNLLNNNYKTHHCLNTFFSKKIRPYCKGYPSFYD